jgi:hypothetical protein
MEQGAVTMMPKAMFDGFETIDVDVDGIRRVSDRHIPAMSGAALRGKQDP